MSAEGLELSANAQDVGEAHEAVEAKYEGTDVTVAFNSQFLLDGIEARTLPTRTREEDELRERMERHGSLAGLFDEVAESDDEEQGGTP